MSLDPPKLNRYQKPRLSRNSKFVLNGRFYRSTRIVLHQPDELRYHCRLEELVPGSFGVE